MLSLSRGAAPPVQDASQKQVHITGLRLKDGIRGFLRDQPGQHAAGSPAAAAAGGTAAGAAGAQQEVAELQLGYDVARAGWAKVTVAADVQAQAASIVQLCDYVEVGQSTPSFPPFLRPLAA